MSLTGKSPSETYKDLVYVSNSNAGVAATNRSLKSGDGTSSALGLSNKNVVVSSSTDNTSAFLVNNSGGNSKFQVDTTNNYVKANGLFVNTQYTHFGINSYYNSAYLAGYHYPIPFVANGLNASGQEDNIHFGNDTDPADTYTTADASGPATSVRADYLVTKLWYISDNIYIDSVTSLEGASTSTGDTTRFHLKSYDFTSGSTNCLTNGSILFHSDGNTNAGNEQPYLETWVADNQSVSSGKVVVAFFESDSVNSDYSLAINIKYHLTG